MDLSWPDRSCHHLQAIKKSFPCGDQTLMCLVSKEIFELACLVSKFKASIAPRPSGPYKTASGVVRRNPILARKLRFAGDCNCCNLLAGIAVRGRVYENEGIPHRK